MTWFYIETEENGFLFNDMAFEEEDIENINVSLSLLLFTKGRIDYIY